jgi:hypothetical protein
MLSEVKDWTIFIDQVEEIARKEFKITEPKKEMTGADLDISTSRVIKFMNKHVAMESPTLMNTGYHGVKKGSKTYQTLMSTYRNWMDIEPGIPTITFVHGGMIGCLIWVNLTTFVIFPETGEIYLSADSDISDLTTES